MLPAIPHPLLVEEGTKNLPQKASTLPLGRGKDREVVTASEIAMYGSFA